MANGQPEAERLARIRSLLAAPSDDPARTLCGSSASIMNTAGAGVVLVSGDRTFGSICCSNAMVEAIEEVQFTLGEGPCLDASRSKAPVLVPDIESPDLQRWPGYRDGARAAGVRAVFGFPLLVGGACIGALNLYQDRVGDLTHEQHADAFAVAHVASRIVLDWQSVAGEGSLAWQLEQVPSHRAVVHQATGMISIQAAVSIDDALALLRARAFADDRPISDVASGIVKGDLRL